MKKNTKDKQLINKQIDFIFLDDFIERYSNQFGENSINFIFDEEHSGDVPNNLEKKGAVTFLDVLGWKGIYQKTDDTNKALNSLLSLVNRANEFVEKNMNNKYNELRVIWQKTDVFSISDTIVILTECNDPATAIKIHADICSYILPLSVKDRIPLRGAISYGSYNYKDRMMVGAAIDEAASWHESTDWIGVVLSPTAQCLLNDNYIGNIIKYDSIPFKKNYKYLHSCVKWNLDKDFDKDELVLDMGPLVPEISGKYMNTFEFLKYVNNYRKKREELPALEGC